LRQAGRGSDACERQLLHLTRTVTSATPPLVSILVRSMGRPELATALASAAAQDHPALEMIARYSGMKAVQ